MAHEKIESMWNLFKKFNFKLENVITDDLICIYCKKMLINAHQAPCGCKFCRKCVEQLIELGNEFCPGNNEECKENLLSKNINISVDYRTNNIIIKLKVKCPNENCDYECEFKNMDEHLDTCKNIISNEVVNDEKSEPIGKDDELMSMVKKLLDSVNQLRHQEEENKIEIDKLKELIEKSDSTHAIPTVELIQNEIEKTKKQDEDKNNITVKDIELKAEDNSHTNVIEGLKRELRKREIKIGSVNKEIDSIKKTYSDELKQQMQVNFDEKLTLFIKDMKSIYETQLRHIRYEFACLDMNSMNAEMKSESNKENMSNGIKNVNLADTYVWRIDELSAKINKGEIICSADFFSQDKGYLMRLFLSKNGDPEMSQSHLSIYLILLEEGCEVGSGFPMNRDVTINIIDQETNVPFKGSTKPCSIKKEDRSPVFNFVYADLSPATVLKDDSIIIECIV